MGAAGVHGRGAGGGRRAKGMGRQRGRGRATVTMTDVARRAGVAPITVSRVLRAPGMVAPAKRAAVEAAIAELGYVPDMVAGTLASRRSRLVAAIVPTLRNSVFAETVQGLTDALRRRGYHLMLGYAGYSPDSEAELLMAFAGRKPDGVVLTGVEHSPRVRDFLRGAGVPTVEIWDLSEDPIDSAVGFDNAAAGALVARHLIARGARRLAVLSQDPADEPRARKRILGFRAAAAAAGLAEPALAALADGLDPAHAVAGFRALLARLPDLDGLFCVNDMLAIAALMEAQRAGLAVPGRLRIAGFGDFDLAAHTLPRLTTVRVPGYAIGERAAGAIVDRIEDAAAAAVRVEMPLELVCRETT